jgi:hypothetical protein
MAAAILLGSASALGAPWLRVVSLVSAAGLACVTAIFQSAQMAVLLLALTAILTGLVVIDLATASRSMRVFAGAVTAAVILVILWVLAHAG